MIFTKKLFERNEFTLDQKNTNSFTEKFLFVVLTFKPLAIKKLLILTIAALVGFSTNSCKKQECPKPEV